MAENKLVETRTVGIVGARGHTGAELIRLLAAHPGFELAAVSSRELAGQRVADHVPGHAGELRYASLAPGELAGLGLDAWVLALPNAKSAPFVDALGTGGTGPVIVTAAGLRRVDLNTVGTVIWAGAGPGLPPVPVDRLVVPPDRCRDLILVDFADRHHPQLRRWSRQRQVAYVENDWLLPGVDPVQSRIEHFLATRPIPRRTP